MKHLEEYLNEEEGSKNQYGSILPDMVHISINSRQTEEMARVLANELHPETFRMFQRWLNHAKQQVDNKVNMAKKSGRGRGLF